MDPVAEVTESIELTRDRWTGLLNILEVIERRQRSNGDQDLAHEIAELNSDIRRQLDGL